MRKGWLIILLAATAAAGERVEVTLYSAENSKIASFVSESYEGVFDLNFHDVYFSGSSYPTSTVVSMALSSPYPSTNLQTLVNVKFESGRGLPISAAYVYNSLTGRWLASTLLQTRKLNSMSLKFDPSKKPTGVVIIIR